MAASALWGEWVRNVKKEEKEEKMIGLRDGRNSWGLESLGMKVSWKGWRGVEWRIGKR